MVNQTLISVKSNVLRHSTRRQNRIVREFVRVKASAEISTTETLISLPTSPQLQVEEAKKAILTAYENGIQKQRIELLLPLIGATDLDDWPGGIRQQFQAAQPLVEEILKGIKELDEFSAQLKGQILDDGDAVGAWQNDNIGLILFPTAETLRPIKQMAENKKLMLFVNPQWQGGQVVSDFGFGPWKKRNEEFVNQFEPTFVYKQIRIAGDNVRILKCYPNKWQLHWIDPQTGKDECIAISDQQLAYKEMEEKLKGLEGAKINMSLVDRLKSEAQFNQQSLNQQQ
eukprot:TRINITY_DN11077_c0_g1_i7.p1 TRINITY_DN11077_c0_g1~~TRINITY_DN11077_c0_g1_i7.p1  ORF type:complete len:285 (+),score=34.14 TRINITY_DN11077_c0_g1_i7:95-949(+)